MEDILIPMLRGNMEDIGGPDASGSQEDGQGESASGSQQAYERENRFAISNPQIQLLTKSIFILGFA